MKNFISIVLLVSLIIFSVTAQAQTWTGSSLVLEHPTLGSNGDYTAIYRADEITDKTILRVMMGDEYTSDLQIGYTYYGTGLWQSNFTLDGYGNTYIRGNVGVGAANPGARISFNNLNDGTNQADGITWYNPAPLTYGIYRTAGSWTPPNYQQLKLSFDTGIILDPGAAYGKSYVDIKGAGLRVTSGNVGIGTTNPGTFKLAVAGKIAANEEVRVFSAGTINFPDYVFDPAYKLPSLFDTELYVKENRHLPEVPTAAEVERDGMSLNEMNIILLKKVEELTLYMIELKKENKELIKRVAKIENKK